MRVFAYLGDEDDLAAMKSFLSVLSVNSSPVEFFGFTRISDETTRELLPAKPDAILVEAGSMARKIERFLGRQAEWFKSCPIIIVYTDASGSDPFADTAFGQISMRHVYSPVVRTTQNILRLLELAVDTARNRA
jgi:hypothetical protein